MRRQSHPARPTGEEVTFESAITVLGADRPYYRGVDALSLAGSTKYEDVAEWLWSGTRTTTETGWPSLDGAVRVAARAQATLPSSALPLDRLQLIVPALGRQRSPAFHGRADSGDRHGADVDRGHGGRTAFAPAGKGGERTHRLAAMARPGEVGTESSALDRPRGRSGPARRPRAGGVDGRRAGRRVRPGRPVRRGECRPWCAVRTDARWRIARRGAHARRHDRTIRYRRSLANVCAGENGFPARDIPFTCTATDAPMCFSRPFGKLTG